jgi:small multidrug resistance family-3 protein
MPVAHSVMLFFAAGLFEVFGGYLVWLWLREGRTVWLGVIGGFILFTYAIAATLQPSEASFGRVYAAYGGVFVVVSLLWGWLIDRRRPDLPTVVGVAISLVGFAVIMYWPRR